MSNGTVKSNAAWYVVQTKPRQEFKALTELSNQRFECFLPILDKSEAAFGKNKNITEPLFSRYLFVRFNESDGKWIKIQHTRGVSRIVSFGGRFAKLPDDCIDSIRETMQLARQMEFHRGDQVSITSGPFEGIRGIFQITDGEERALILIDILSQPRNIGFPIKNIRKA